MKNTLATLIATMTVLAVGCDPGMSIRQTKSSYEATNGASATGARIVIDVKTTRQIIGETHDAPQVKITNASTSSIAITSVDLISLGTTYATSLYSLDSIRWRYNRGRQKIFSFVLTSTTP